MGILSNSRLIHRLGRPDLAVPLEAQAHGGGAGVLRGNPFQLGTLSTLAWDADVFGNLETMTRAQAMTIPGVARGRGVLVSMFCDKPLVDYVHNPSRSDASEPTEPQPPWLYHTTGWAGPFQRMALSLDDHVFYGETLWGVQRGAAVSGLRPVINAWHIPYESWEIDPAGRICVVDEDGRMIPADDDEVIYIPAAHEGLLAYASRTLRGAVDLERAWISRAKNPIPALDLHETEDTGLEREERQQVVDDWAAARGDLNGSIASTPYNIDARVLGTVDPALFIEGRNAVRLDIANFFQLPAALLDATTATASLTYTTQESAQSSVDVMTAPYWVRPFEDRLSQDDVVPRGHIVRFAFALAYTEPPGPIITDTADLAAPIIDAAVQTRTADAISAGETP